MAGSTAGMDAGALEERHLKGHHEACSVSGAERTIGRGTVSAPGSWNLLLDEGQYIGHATRGGHATPCHTSNAQRNRERGWRLLLTILARYLPCQTSGG